MAATLNGSASFYCEAGNLRAYLACQKQCRDCKRQEHESQVVERKLRYANKVRFSRTRKPR